MNPNHKTLTLTLTPNPNPYPSPNPNATPAKVIKKMDHLVCFVPGTLALGAQHIPEVPDEHMTLLTLTLTLTPTLTLTRCTTST